MSPQQVALAWMLAKSPVVIPIPGSSRPETILDSIAAADLVLTGAGLARLGRGAWSIAVAPAAIIDTPGRTAVDRACRGA